MFVKGHTPAHKGQVTTTDPLKTPEAVNAVKALLANSVRDLALWTTAVNSAYRAGDLCTMKWDDTEDDGECIELHVREGKTKKLRTVRLNPQASAILRKWRAICECEFIYSGQRGALSTATWGRMVKDWCKQAGFDGNFCSHTARKTFVRVQHDAFGTSLPVLMKVLNHSTELQTLTYMGRLDDDTAKAYANSL